MAEQNDAGNSSEERVVEPLKEGFKYEDEHGSITIHRRDMKKLNISNGDVVVIKRFDGLTVQTIEWIADELDKKGYGECIVTVVDKLSDVKSLDESTMNKYGWFRYDGRE